MGGFFRLIVESATLYIKHQAWLDSIPEKSNNTRRESHQDSPLSEVEPEYYCAWLVNTAISCGLTQQTGFGLVPITWNEIESWQAVTGNHDKWIAMTIKNLSYAYIAEYRAGVDPGRGSPLYDTLEVKERREAVSKQFQKFIKGR